MLNILIVEDEINLGSTLEEYLRGLGHVVANWFCRGGRCGRRLVDLCPRGRDPRSRQAATSLSFQAYVYL
jgi:hypothetical protein